MTVIFVEAINCCTTNDAWARASSWLWAQEKLCHYLDVCSAWFPSIPSECLSRFFHSLCPGWKKFLVHDAFNVKKTNQRKFDIALSLSCFLRSQWIWSLPLRLLLLCLRVINKHPRFVTGNDGGDKVGVVFGLFFQLSADRYAVFTARQP